MQQRVAALETLVRELQARLNANASNSSLPPSANSPADLKAAAFCTNLLGLLPSVWRFVVTDGVEPTINHAERLLRRGVLWRKNAFGSQSPASCRFVERLRRVVQTRRLQGRSTLRYLVEALSAHRGCLPAPSLLTNG